MLYQNETFSGEVELDSNDFDTCTFSEALLIYSGGTPPILNECSFTDTKFQFRGAARNTVALLKGMSAPNSGLQNIVRDTFPGLMAH